MKLYCGTSGYGYKEWKGVFYPEKISPKAMLRFYGERLNAVEINYTFHHMPTERLLASWAEQVGNNFAFSLKAPQVITHLKKLRDVDEEAGYFFKTASILGSRLGPPLFQFPKWFHADRTVLEAFLALVPENIRCTFEFRHPSWLDPAILALLRERSCSLCIADTDELPAEEIISTAPWGYLRLRRADYTENDLRQWMEKIVSQRWERVFVYFKHEEEAKGPELAMQFNEITRERL